MGRKALVVGINAYNCKELGRLRSPARDAEAIAQLNRGPLGLVHAPLLSLYP